VRIFKNRHFDRWAAREGLADDSLIAAVQEIEDGLIDANLGGSVYKKRVAIGGKGKSSGSRTLLAFRKEDRTFFMYGFAKNQRTNIKDKELKALKRLAKEYLRYETKDLEKAMKAKVLIEVSNSD
jgi:hypothetical protein